MPPKIFIDTNVFIYSFEFPYSNSRKVIDLLNKGQIEAVISSRVFTEVLNYFNKYHGEKLSKHFRRYLSQSCFLIPAKFAEDIMEKLKGQIKEKDLEQIAVVRKLSITHLVAYDRDFKEFKEYTTPKEFIELMGINASDTDY